MVWICYKPISKKQMWNVLITLDCSVHTFWHLTTDTNSVSFRSVLRQGKYIGVKKLRDEGLRYSLHFVDRTIQSRYSNCLFSSHKIYFQIRNYFGKLRSGILIIYNEIWSLWLLHLSDTPSNQWPILEWLDTSFFSHIGMSWHVSRD